MVMSIYKRALEVIAKKPFKLWGISLLSIFLQSVFVALCGVAIPGLGLAVGLLLSTSMTMVFLNGLRGEDVKSTDLFECCKDWKTAKRVLCGMAWTDLWVFLWALIPFVGVIFAIIKAYSYRLVPYILVTEPDVKATEAIKVSEARTKGYRGKMFIADFLVYIFIFLACIVLGAFSSIRYIGWLFGIILVLLMVAVVLFISLFTGLVKAGFYEEIERSRKAPILIETQAEQFGTQDNNEN